MPGLRRSAVFALLFCAVASGASAHTAFMKAESYAMDGAKANVTLAFGRTFFEPEIAINAPDMHALRPDGQRIGFDSLAVSAQRTDLEVAMWRDGTYRFTTGEMLGAVSNMVLDGEQWRPVTAGEVLPPEAQTSTLQTVTVAETYISHGWPSDTNLAPTIGRLAIHPITNPNLVSVESGLDLQLLFGGAPFPNMPFVVNAAGEPESDFDTTFVTDDQGRAHLTFTQPGVYVATVRYRGPAPEGAAAKVQSYTTSLTFEVVSVLPSPPPPPEPERGRRRRRT